MHVSLERAHGRETGCNVPHTPKEMKYTQEHLLFLLRFLSRPGLPVDRDFPGIVDFIRARLQADKRANQSSRSGSRAGCRCS